MSKDIVISAVFAFVDWDYNISWHDICQLKSLDELKDICINDGIGNLDGCLGGKLIFDKECGCGDARNITGADWYGFQETDKGVNYLQTPKEEDITEYRYKGVVKVRGKNVPDGLMCQFNKELRLA